MRTAEALYLSVDGETAGSSRLRRAGNCREVLGDAVAADYRGYGNFFFLLKFAANNGFSVYSSRTCR